MEEKTTTPHTTETICHCEGKGREGRERQSRTVEDDQPQIKTLCWIFALSRAHPDSSFFREGQCKKCVFCSDDFHFLHYTSESSGYCVKCYLDKFCNVVDDENVFRVIIKRTGRVLIEIRNS
jgi:hypothetical protein